MTYESRHWKNHRGYCDKQYREDMREFKKDLLGLHYYGDPLFEKKHKPSRTHSKNKAVLFISIGKYEDGEAFDYNVDYDNLTWSIRWRTKEYVTNELDKR